MKTNTRHRLMASTLLFGVATIAMPAFAQDATPTTTDCVDADANGVCDANETVSNADGTTSTGGDSIVVTGSRIARSTFNSPSPLTVITKDDTVQAGFDSAAQLLQSTAVTAGARQIDSTFTGFITDGGPGANTLSLRSLGAARTLILLNGRRLAPSGTSGSLLSADLNVLPSAIVDRIEVLKDGASSIYGSDAIAGVVNIITDRKATGVTLDGSVSVPEMGEGVSKRLALIAGYAGDRFRFSTSLEVLDRARQSYNSHDYLQCQTEYIRSGVGQPFGSGDFKDPRTGKPKCYPTGFTGVNGVTVNTIGTSTIAGAAGGPGNPAFGTFNRFRPNAAAGGSVPGYEGVNGGGSSALGNRDTVSQGYLNRSLVSPTRNYNGYLQATYDLQALGDAQIYVDALVTRRESAQPNWFQFIIDYWRGSPLIPSALTFSNIGATDQSGGRAVGVRVFSERTYTATQRVDYERVGGGIRGSLPFEGWNYDFFVSQSYNFGEYTLNQPITTRMQQSQDVVLSNGVYVCRDTSNGCVAAPALTPALIGGDYPRAFLDFVAPPVKGTTQFWETTFSAGFNGSVFSLPAGDVGIALGAEYRRQRISDNPPIEQQTGLLYNFSTAGVTKGRDAVKEVFGEIEVPLLRDTPFFNELTLNASARYTDYDSYGSGWTYKLGGVWSPVSALTLRATYGTSYRAPSLSEQFQAPTAGFLSNTVDPCYQYGLKSPTTTIYKNCQAAGIPLNYGDGVAGSPLGQNVRVLSTGGAGTGLAAETSTNFTAGVILRAPLPSSLGKLEFAGDYFDIKVENGVAQFGGGNIIASCYNDAQFTAGTNGGELCALVTREGANGLNPYRATVTNSYINISESGARGLDFDLRYVVPLGDASLRLNAGATHYLKQTNQTFSTNPVVDRNGYIYFPKWTGTADATLKLGQVSLFYQLNWVGEMDSYEQFGENRATSIYQLATPDYFTHTASIRWTNDVYSMNLGVRNFTDKTPPFISAYVTNRLGNAPQYSGYDFIGRTFFLNFTAKVM